MKVSLRPITTYAAEINGRDISTFRVDSSWAGMTRLRGEKGSRLLIVRSPTPLQDPVSALTDDRIEVELVEARSIPKTLLDPTPSGEDEGTPGATR